MKAQRGINDYQQIDSCSYR